MPLTICPDCSREISNRANACPHCGCPMGEAEQNQSLYAVVLRAADYNDPKMVERIQAATGLSEEEAEALRRKIPVTIKRGLTYDRCNDLIRTFSAKTHLEVIQDEDADTPDNAVPIAQSIPQTTKPITFWTIVGAIITALALWCAILLMLFLFFR